MKPRIIAIALLIALLAVPTATGPPQESRKQRRKRMRDDATRLAM